MTALNALRSSEPGPVAVPARGRSWPRLLAVPVVVLVVLGIMGVAVSVSLPSATAGTARVGLYAGTGKDYLNNAPRWTAESTGKFSFQLSADGARLNDFRGTYFYYCGDGTGTISAPSLAVSPAGTFSYRSSGRNSSFGKPDGRWYLSLSGHFLTDRTAAHITYLVDFVFPKTPRVVAPYDESTPTKLGCASLVEGTAKTASRAKGTPPLAKAGPTTSRQPRSWELARDFQAHPDVNPAPDSYGDTGVWTFMESASLARDGRYSLLLNHEVDFDGSTGTVAWTGDQAVSCPTGSGDLPQVGVNTSAKTASGCDSWSTPPHTTDLHPGATQMAIVAWDSPVTGSVSISGGVTSLDPHGGGGIRYYIYSGSSQLLAGAIPDRGSALFPGLNVPVKRGSQLYFMIAPPTKGFGYNSTALDLTIRSLGAAGDQSSLASSLPSPPSALGSVRHDVEVLAVAGAVTLFIAFPAQLFNHTFQENYDDIVGFLPKRFPRLQRAGKAARKSIDERLGSFGGHARLALVVLAGAFLASLLDPSFGVSWKSLETYLGMLCASLASLALSAFVASSYRRRTNKPRAFTLQALPAGLLVAGLCVAVSRTTGFEPGYLYGIVAGVAFTEQLTDREEAHTAALCMSATLVVATVAWLLWDVVNSHATHAGADVPLVVLDDMLAAIFAGGLTGAVISLLPLRFLPGGRIAAWHKGAWSVVFLAALSGLIGVLLWPRRDSHAGTAPITTVVALLVVFGGVSVLFWLFFERRKAAEERASEATEGADRPAADAGSAPVAPESGD